MTVASSETGELTTYWDYTDVPYTYDEENMILTVNISEDTYKRWEFDSVSADRFVIKGDWISYYRETVDAIKSLVIDPDVPKIYKLDGISSKNLDRGVNLIRKSDGSVRKVYVK